MREHAEYNKTHKTKIYDEALSSFFRNVDSRFKESRDLAVGSEITDLKARAIVVDMECGVIDNKILGGDFKDIFEARQCIKD